MSNTTLSPSQTTVLAGAAGNPRGAVHPLPPDLQLNSSAVAKVLAALARHGLVTGVDTTARLTEAGQAVADEIAAAATAHQASTGAAAPETKTARILALLERTDGASLDELMAATGWQAHSVRGFLSGTVRKKRGWR